MWVTICGCWLLVPIFILLNGAAMLWLLVVRPRPSPTTGRKTPAATPLDRLLILW
jgi:hypothetical protein